ncbi:hypothetical protein BH10PSE19_BH10PSE19_03280 [soil metagenome]
MTKTSFIFKIILIFCIFLVPLLVAWYFYDARSVTQATTNHGYLLRSAIAVESLGLKPLKNESMTQGKWLLIYIYPTDCDKHCAQQLYFMRQVRTALGKDRDRLERIVVTPEGLATPLLQPLLVAEYKGTQQMQIKPTALTNFLQQIPHATAVLPQGVLLIVDPLGNIVLFYSPTVKPRDWLRDLKRLLSVSQIG